MTVVLVERTLAVIGAFLVAGTASIQLKNEIPVRGLDANVAKALLGLMIVGCLFAVLAALRILGG